MKPVAAGLRSAYALLLSSLLLVVGTAGASDASGELLAFEEVPDGRCQILSEGGKLVVLKNLHPGQGVRFRLIRRFMGVPQGRLDGTIEADSPPPKLGCSRVDGRVQSWTVERASLIEETE
jgi:hypothetical protein